MCHLKTRSLRTRFSRGQPVPLEVMVRADVVIVGAGIAGVSVAYHLAVRHGVQRVIVCDPRPPLSLTSDKSTECYRNWWPQPAMVDLMNRSIALLEELACPMDARGYAYFTGSDPAGLLARARSASAAGAGPLRVHQLFGGEAPCQVAQQWDRMTTGADFVTDPDIISRVFPSATKDATAVLHTRRAGWIDAHQLGARLLDEARGAGVTLHRSEVVDVDRDSQGVSGVRLRDGTQIDTRAVVLAAGPLIGRAVAMLGETLPIHAELHLKVAFKDHARVVPRGAPLMIWDDPQRIAWDAEEEEAVAEYDHRLIEELPGGCHLRPEGGPDSPWVLGLWEWQRTVMDPVFPIPVVPMQAEIVLRGLMTMLPGLNVYRERLPRAVVDGGYYLATPENLPLIGPLRTPGAFVIGALSGFGIMASQAAAELVALHVSGHALPRYADAFRVERYDDPSYLAATAGETGQL
jgi:glycine/D-amino acid oxidase-like deaminating enzyme